MRKYHQSSIKGQHSADENGGAEADKVRRLTIIHTNISAIKERVHLPAGVRFSLDSISLKFSKPWMKFYGIYCIANANLYPILKCLISCKLTCIHSHSLSRKIRIYCSLNAHNIYSINFLSFLLFWGGQVFFTPLPENMIISVVNSILLQFLSRFSGFR